MILEFDYTNYKGATSHRRVQFERVRFGASPWHQKPQWLMQAFDLDKNEFREFALRDMTNIKEIGAEPYNPHSPVVETIKRKS